MRRAIFLAKRAPIIRHPRDFSTAQTLPKQLNSFPRASRPSNQARRKDTHPKHKSSQKRKSASQGIKREPQQTLAKALQLSSNNDTNKLSAPVHIPEDQHAILRSDHPATAILANSSIVVQRQLEMMNVFLGFEQANKYVLMDSTGNQIGFLAEQEHGVGNAVARQAFRTHRSFTTHVFDKHEREILRFHRPFAWISSRIKVYDALNPSHNPNQRSETPSSNSQEMISLQSEEQTSSLSTSDMRLIGEAQQKWAPLRRKYNLYLHRPLSQEPSEAPQLTSGDIPISTSTALQTTSSESENHGFAQFAYVDEPFLSWDFSLKTEDEGLLGSVNRNFAGLAREIFTDTGVYALRMDSAGLAAEPSHLISQTARTSQDSDQDGNPLTQGDSTAGMTLDQRAVMLATAVSIDFDYFSRHSNSHGGGMGFMPMWFPGGGGGSGEAGGAEGGAEGGAAGEVGAAGQAGGDDASPTWGGSSDPYDGSPTGQGDDDFWGGFGGAGGGEGGSGASSGRGGGSGASSDGENSGGDVGGSGDGGDGFDFDWF